MGFLFSNISIKTIPISDILCYNEILRFFRR